MLEAESLSLLCSAYLTLSYKIPSFSQSEEARSLKTSLSAFIEKTLADASVLRHGPCDYSFLLSILDERTKNFLLYEARSEQQSNSEGEDFLTKAICRVSSGRQKVSEDEFKRLAAKDDWIEILKAAFVRGLSCLPFYQKTKGKDKLQFLGWFVDPCTVVLTEKTLVALMSAMFSPYPKWRSRLSQSNRERFSAELEQVFYQLGLTPLKTARQKGLFCDVLIGKLTLHRAVVLRFKPDFGFRELLPSNPTPQDYRLLEPEPIQLSQDPSETNSHAFSVEPPKNFTSSHLKALGLIR